jgi:UDP-glucose 4-epimerase
VSRLLVTGGGGFVLSHLVRHWTELAPSNRVIVVDAEPLDASAKEFFEPSSEQISVVQGDVSDIATWDRLRDHADGISHVVHGAAVTSIDRLCRAGGLRAIAPAMATNMMGITHALGFAGELPDLMRFIFVSSGSVYDNHGHQAPGQPLPEDGSVNPSGFYAISKFAGEMLTTQAMSGTGLPSLSVRLSGVYGPLDRTTASRDVHCAPKKILHQLRNGREIGVSGLDAVGDYIHASDVAHAIAGLLTCVRPRHPVYNIALGEFITLRELLALASEINPSLQFRETSSDDADIAGEANLTQGRWGAYDISRLIADTGWHPRPLAVALRDYAEWLGDNAY